MTKNLILALAFSAQLTTLACSDGDSTSCADIYEGAFAIEIVLDKNECDSTGTATRTGEVDEDGNLIELDVPEVFELACEVIGSDCVCSAGDEFGRYEVSLTDESGETQVAIIDVEREARPVCLNRDVVQPFGEGNGGGAGGMGGSP